MTLRRFPAPESLLPVVGRVLETEGPCAWLLAGAIADLMPATVDREEVYRDLLDKLRGEMFPAPLNLVERSRLAVTAWRCLPVDLRG